MYNRIVLTLDGSAYSRCALPHAAAMARAFGVKLVLLQVIPYPEVLDAGVEVDYARVARRYMEEITQEPCTQGLEMEIEVLWGEIVAKIVEFVEADPATLLVMSSHGRTGLTKLAFGSVTESVLREARSTPSLVCRCLHDEVAEP